MLDRLRLSEALNAMLLATSRSEDIVELLQTMVQTMGRALMVDRCLIYDVRLHDGVADGLCEWLNPETQNLASSIGTYPLDLFRRDCEWVCEHRRGLESHRAEPHPLLLADASADLLHGQMQIRSLIWHPFDFEDGRFFLLVFNHVSCSHSWTKEELEFIEGAADYVSMALKKVRLLRELHRRERSLRSEKSLFTSGPVVVFRCIAREGWPIEYVSGNIDQFGYSAAELSSGAVPFASLVHRDDLERVARGVATHSGRGASDCEQEYRIRHKNGTVRFVYDFTRIIRDEDGDITHYDGYLFDVTDRKEIEEDLFEEKEQAIVTLSSIGDAVITTDVQGNVRFLNPVAEALTGWSNAEALVRSVESITPLIDEMTDRPLMSPIVTALVEDRKVDLSQNAVLVDRGGRRIAIEASAAPIRNRQGETIGVVMVLQDVGEARKLARELEWQARHDPLTELPNRREFEREVEELLNDAMAREQSCLLYLDLDQFKVVNDTCGHTAGDRLLRELPPIMAAALRPTDLLARLGGDEFGVLLRRVTVDEAIKTAERLVEGMRSYHFVCDSKLYDIGVSIGLVQVNNHTMGSLLSSADMACFMAKEKGRNRLHVYRPNDEEIARRELEMGWVVKLNRAIQERRFVLFHQEIVALDESKKSERHVEILLRMNGGEQGIIGPGEFLPAAERYNLMGTIDQWVVDSSLGSYAANKRALEEAGVVFSINVSGASLTDGRILHYVRERIRHYGLSPHCICIEITETSAIANLARIHVLMSDLKNDGLRFALDDFGSGLSSYAYLKHLPVDYIKIDGDFVRDIVDDPMDRAIVESINYLGHSMKLGTIAESVECEEVRARLREIGVDYAQGFALHRPEPLENLLA